MFGAMYAVYFAFGVILLAIPPMAGDVRAELGISRGMLGFALGAWALLYIVTAPPAGQIIDRIGLRRSLAAGSLLIAASAALQSTAQGLAMLWLAIGVIGVGGPMVSLSAPKLVATWFGDPRERALAVGFYTSAPALGGAFALALTNSVLLPALGGWRSVLLFEAGINIVAAVVWIVISGVARHQPAAAGPSDIGWVPPKQHVKLLFTSRGVRLAMVLGIGTFFVTQGLSAWLPSMLQEHTGLSVGAAANWAAASMAVGILTRLVLPGLVSSERRSMMLHVVMIVLVIAMLAMAVGPPAVDVTAALALGFRSALNALVIVVLMEADHVTTANIGLAYGLWFSAVQIGGGLGPQVVGVFGDSRFGFPGALVAMSVMLVAMVAVLFNDDRRRRWRIAMPGAETGPLPPDVSGTAHSAAINSAAINSAGSRDGL